MVFNIVHKSQRFAYVLPGFYTFFAGQGVSGVFFGFVRRDNSGLPPAGRCTVIFLGRFWLCFFLCLARSDMLALHPAQQAPSNIDGGIYDFLRSKNFWNRARTVPFVCDPFFRRFDTRDPQVFSVTHRVRKRHEVMKSSDVRLWKWLSDDVLAIVTKTVGGLLTYWIYM